MNNPYITREQIQKIFFNSKMDDPNGIYLDPSADFDLVEYSNNLIGFVQEAIAKTERGLCIDFVRSLNSEVANALEQKRGKV